MPDTDGNEESTGKAIANQRIGAESIINLQQQLSDSISQLRKKQFKRVTPSETDQRNLTAAQVDVEDQQDSRIQAPEGIPSGMLWGSVIHRAAELIVCDGKFTPDSVRESSRQAVKEQFRSELLSRKQRNDLAIPPEAITIDQIQNDLISKVSGNLQFMTDPDSMFRRMIKGAKLYPEIPFTVSATKDQCEFFDKLKEIVNWQGEERIEVTGKIDLALEDEDGTWRIIDYKTDHMLPVDNGSKTAFHERLNRQYSSQLELYKIVLQYLAGKEVKEACLLSV